MTSYGPGDVTYTVKELIGRLEGKIDALLAIASQKADTAAVNAIEARVAVLERRSDAGLAVSRFRALVVANAIAMLGAIATIVWLIHG